MKYLFLAYQNTRMWEAMPALIRDTFIKECHASDEALQEAGYLLERGSLLGGDVVTVRILNGEISLNQDPTSKKDMQLFEALLVTAVDLNEAIRVASRMAQAKSGMVEIRLLIQPFD